MKNFGKLRRKLLVLMLLLACLGWVSYDKNVALSASDCLECHDEHAVCIAGCNDDPACLNDCHIMRNHCILFCD
jgi:hypothetical protein